ncbi:MAG: DUF366 family protein [Oligoflexia bacterium]|nr:DUF366 family protein [Oligoflexia bacterium]
MLTTLFSETERTYTGSELRPHFLLTELNLKGSGIGAFQGPCRVETAKLVDWEDRLANDHIAAHSMIHFIGEFFGTSLREGVLIQRLFMSVAFESLLTRVQAQGWQIRRSGDDLYLKKSGSEAERKLSVSIVTASPVSQLLHVGINIDPSGATVPAIGLAELQVDPQAWAKEVLSRFAEEWEGMEWACVKVRPVV